MKIFIQRLKIVITSAVLLGTLGILLHVLAYFSNESTTISIVVFLVIVAVLLSFHTVLHRMYRVLLVLKYREIKEDDR